MSTTPYDTALISISSADALDIPVDDGSAFKLPMQSNLNDVISYRIKDISIPQTWYNIDGVNSIFSLTGNVTGSLGTVIPAGNYSAAQLASTVSAAWLALTGTNITLDFTNPNYRLVVTRTGGVDATIRLDPINLTLSMKYIFGFTGTQPASASLTADSAFTLTGPNKILVQSLALNVGRNMSGFKAYGATLGGQIIKNNVIWNVYRQGNAGDRLVNQIPSDWYSFQTPQKIGSIDLYLTDEFNNPLNLNGYAWSITLEFRQKKNV